jgi:hypothetical protein
MQSWDGEQPLIQYNRLLERDKMAEEVSTTVKSVSDGMVKISVEAYQDLLTKAAEKPPIVHRHVNRTIDIVAADNKMIGGSLMGFGVALLVIGGAIYLKGRAQATSV